MRGCISRDPGLPQSLADLFPARLVDSDLGEIPEGWEAGTVADLSALNPETWTKGERPTEIRYIDLSNAKGGRIEAITPYKAAEAPSRAQRVLRPGDTIVGTVRPGKGLRRDGQPIIRYRAYSDGKRLRRRQPQRADGSIEKGGYPMRVDIRDARALRAISPAALSAYARSAGWKKTEGYGAHSDVYVAKEMPEIILPQTERLGDYASVVSRLITIFAETAGRDELSLYRDLVTADRDVVRARITETDDGSLTLNHGVDLISGARDLVLAAACSLRESQPLYRLGANREANELLEGIRLGQTEHGSFVVTLLTPVVSPPLPSLLQPQEYDGSDDPIERKRPK